MSTIEYLNTYLLTTVLQVKLMSTIHGPNEKYKFLIYTDFFSIVQEKRNLNQTLPLPETQISALTYIPEIVQ